MEFDKTLFIQGAIYLFLFFVLKSLYFQPILSLLKKRDSLTGGKLGETQRLKTKLESISTHYNAQMKAAREAVETRRLEAIQRARVSADEQVRDAKQKAEKALGDYKEQLEREAKSLRSKFSSLASDLKKEIVSAMTTSKVVRL